MSEIETRVSRAGRGNPCPGCGSRNVADIGYGMPAPEFCESEAYRSGDVVLGGCVIYPEMPMLHCRSCDTEWNPDGAGEG